MTVGQRIKAGTNKLDARQLFESYGKKGPKNASARSPIPSIPVSAMLQRAMGRASTTDWAVAVPAKTTAAIAAGAAKSLKGCHILGLLFPSFRRA